MIRTQVQLTEKQLIMVKRIAAEQNVSMSEIIRQGLDSYLQQSIEPDKGERIRRALAIVGKYRSGYSNISERHDEHLDEAFSK